MSGSGARSGLELYRSHLMAEAEGVDANIVGAVQPEVCFQEAAVQFAGLEGMDLAPWSGPPRHDEREIPHVGADVEDGHALLGRSHDAAGLFRFVGAGDKVNAGGQDPPGAPERAPLDADADRRKEPLDELVQGSIVHS